MQQSFNDAPLTRKFIFLDNQNRVLFYFILFFFVSFFFVQMFPWCIFALIFSLTTKISGEAEQGVYFQIEENAFLSDENTLHNEKADSLMACARICARKAACKSANFLRNEGTCSLLGKERRTSMVEKFVKRDGSFYVEKVFWGFLQIFIFDFMFLTFTLLRS